MSDNRRGWFPPLFLSRIRHQNTLAVEPGERVHLHSFLLRSDGNLFSLSSPRRCNVSPPAARTCLVSFTDSEGIRHAVEVSASSLLPIYFK
jgi:hypothetical protein